MKSKKLNKEIEKLSDKTEIYQCFGWKAIPYIGWFWRTVDFSSDHCFLGVMKKDDNKKVIGFMQNNKWDYDSIRVDGEKWEKLKQLLEIAIDKKDHDSLKNVDDYMQSLIF